jgi:4-diphosphocytidyl-2-C-methyl-D-erythritol kinase
MLSLKAFAKINLYLDVLSRYPDGYHQIESVMQSVSLFDFVEIRPSSRINLSCSNKELESKDNLAFRAAELLKTKTGTGSGASINIIKQIPIAAGLAGGSADAAATLIGLNELWSLDLTTARLQEIGRELGADVPFCCEGGTMLAQGKGEKLNPVPALSPAVIAIATPPILVSTAEIYSELDNRGYTALNRKNEMVEALSSKDIEQVSKSLSNILETVALKRYPEIDQIKEQAIKAGCMGALMSGSGPSVFAFFKNERQARVFIESLRAKNKNIFTNITKAVEYGAKIM